MEALARSRLPQILGDAFGVQPGEVRLGPVVGEARGLRLRAAGRSFLVLVIGRPTPALLAHWERLRGVARKGEVPVVFSSSMGPTWRGLCEAQGINWMDLSGNANVRAPGLRVRIDGRPPVAVRPGRPASVFERRGSRLARLLLQHPGREWTVRTCARESGLNEGHVSRLVARLVADGYLRKDGKQLRVADPRSLAEAWREAADFSKHQVIRGHVAARSGEELLGLVSKRLADVRIEHAATGLGAAWCYDHFAMFRLASFFIREWPRAEHLEQLRFREEATGANVWLVLPEDDGVFDGVRVVDGVPCVHPVQTYVDLKGHPERAAEAAEHLKQGLFLQRAARGNA